jgi:hypothetical protein
MAAGGFDLNNALPEGNMPGGQPTGVPGRPDGDPYWAMSLLQASTTRSRPVRLAA